MPARALCAAPSRAGYLYVYVWLAAAWHVAFCAMCRVQRLATKPWCACALGKCAAFMRPFCMYLSTYV